MTARILLIEDEESLVVTLADALGAEGYEVETARHGLEGFHLARKKTFDALILDIILPEKTGFDICRDLRGQGVQTPILMLTARGQLVDKVLGFRLGADDYLTKPFEIPELLVRLEAILRRSGGSSASELQNSFDFGSVRVDLRRAQVFRDGVLVELSAREFELLHYFIENPERVISRQELLAEVWDYPAAVLTRTVDVHVGQLRKKLDQDPKNPVYFVTVRGLGYRFVPDLV